MAVSLHPQNEFNLSVRISIKRLFSSVGQST